MCTNRALVNSLECYMDDLVDCFEDFVKKSVIVISVAVGLLVAMIAYVLKTIVDRSQPSSATGDTNPGGTLSRTQGDQIQSGDSDSIWKMGRPQIRSRNITKDNFMLFDIQDDKGTSTTSANDQICADEKVLKNIAFTGCTKPNCKGCYGFESLSTTRLSIPSLPMDQKRTSPIPGQPRTPKSDDKLDSCCSMCCDDKCER